MARNMLHRYSLVLACVGIAGAAMGQTYRPIDLGSLHGWAEAEAVNNGRVVAGSTMGARGRSRGFLWDGELDAIGTPAPFTQAEGVDINAVSRAVFAVYSMGDVGAHAVVIGPDGVAQELGGFCPRAINRAGGVVGARDSVDPATGLVSTQAVLWRRGTLTVLPPLDGGAFSAALDVSNNGLIVGSAFGPGALAPTAVLWRRGAIAGLGTLGRTPAQATCISPSGRYVAGFSATATAPLHAFRYKLNSTGGVVRRRDLGTLAEGGWSVAYDTNNAGQVVGSSDGRAFLYSRGEMIDLNARISPGLGWTLLGATGINTRGDIVGWGNHGASGPRAFLLVEVCSPADIAEPFGVLDAADLDSFVAQYDAGNLAEADLTGTRVPGAPGYGEPDGVVSEDDFVYYMTVYAAGC